MNNREIECKCGRMFTPRLNNGIIASRKCPTCMYSSASSKASKKPKAPRFAKSSPLKTRSRKAVERDLDNAWSYLVKLRAGRKCEYCGLTTTLNSHHINSRGKKSTRWDVKNGICLCVDHHIGTTFSAHKTLPAFAMWLNNHRSPKELDLVYAAYLTPSNLSIFELEVLLIELRKEIKILES